MDLTDHLLTIVLLEVALSTDFESEVLLPMLCQCLFLKCPFGSRILNVRLALVLSTETNCCLKTFIVTNFSSRSFPEAVRAVIGCVQGVCVSFVARNGESIAITVSFGHGSSLSSR